MPSCAALQADKARLAMLSEQQDKAARDDVVMVLIFGIPTAKLAGQDNAKEIAYLKGKVRACSAM